MRYAGRYGVPLQQNPHFPINTLLLMRGAVAMQLRHVERFDAYLTPSSTRSGSTVAT